MIFPVLLALCIARSGYAQTQPTLAEEAIPQVYLVTFEPGDEAWERFGHDALLVGDPNGNADLR